MHQVRRRDPIPPLSHPTKPLESIEPLRALPNPRSEKHRHGAPTWDALAVMAAAGAIFVNLDLARPGRWKPR